MNTSACPDESIIQGLFSSENAITEFKSLEEHLLNCEKCAALADSLVMSGEITALLSRAETQLFRTREVQLVEQLIERAKNLKWKVRSASEQTVVGASDDVLQTQGNGLTTLGDSSGPTSFLRPAELQDEIGRLGGYRVLEVLGSGGMGVVFRAEDPGLRRQVALKVMKPSVAANPDAKTRFLKEAEATAAIEHDNIVTIYQVGEDNGVPFFAMQFLKGESLQRRIDREGRLSKANVLRIGREIADGLQVAHSHGLIHRDIKPDNIWLQDGNDRVRIVDFGLVRNNAEEAGLTQSGIVLGTPKYMSPEQARGENVDCRCDLFSLGSVLYRLVSGMAPFEGSNLTATLIAVAHHDPKPLSDIAPDCDSDLNDLIMRLLSKDREQRPTSAADVSRALADLQKLPGAKEVAPLVPTAGHRESNSESSETLVEPALNRHWRPPGRRKLLAGLGGFMALLILAMLIIKLRTKDGTVVIELESATPISQVEVDGNSVSFQADDSGRKLTLTVPVGKHALSLKTPEGLKLTTNLGSQPVDVAVNDTTTIRAWMEKDSISAEGTTGKEMQESAPQNVLGAKKDLATTWQPGPDMPWAELKLPNLMDGDSVPGIIDRPTVFEGVKSWNVDTRFPRAQVHSVEYSPDGKWLAVSSADGHIRIYDTITMVLKTLLPGLGIGFGVADLSWHPDSSRIAAICDGTNSFRIWTLNGQIVFENEAGYASSYTAVKWLSGGQHLICAGRSAFDVRDPDGRLIKTLLTNDQAGCLHYAEVAVSPTGNEFACVHADGVMIWNIDTGTFQRIGDAPQKRIMVGHAIAWSSSDVISVVDSDGIVLFEGENHATTRRLKCVNGPASVAWHPNGKQLAAWISGRVALVDVVNDDAGVSSEWLAVAAHEGPIPTGLNWSPDGKRLAAASGEVCICNEPLTRLIFSSGVTSQSITGVSCHPVDGEFLSVSASVGSDVLRWSNDGQLIERLPIQARDVHFLGVDWSPDGRKFLTRGNDDSGGSVWLGRRGEPIRKVNSVGCCSTAWSPDSQFAALGFGDGVIRILNSNGELGQELSLPVKEKILVAWSSKNVLIAQAGKDLFQMIQTGERMQAELFVSVPNLPHERAPRWNPDGSYFEVWNFQSTSRVSADGTQISTSSDHCRPGAWNNSGDSALCLVWPDQSLSLHAKDGKLLRRRGTNGAHVWDAADCSHSGDLMIVGSDQGLVTGVHSGALVPEWTAVVLAENKTVTFSAGGQIVDGTRETVDQSLVYYTADSKGKVETLLPADFELRIREDILPITGRLFDREYGFTISVDTSWKPAPLEAYIVPGIARMAFSRPGGVSLNVFIQDTGALIDVSWLLAESTKAQEEKVAVNFLTKEVRKVAGRDAMWMVVEGLGTGSAITGNGPVKTTQHWIAIPRETDVVVVLLTCPSGSFAANDELFLKTVESLKLRVP